MAELTTQDANIRQIQLDRKSTINKAKTLREQDLANRENNEQEQDLPSAVSHVHRMKQLGDLQQANESVVDEAQQRAMLEQIRTEQDQQHR